MNARRAEDDESSGVVVGVAAAASAPALPPLRTCAMVACVGPRGDRAGRRGLGELGKDVAARARAERRKAGVCRVQQHAIEFVLPFGSCVVCRLVVVCPSG